MNLITTEYRGQRQHETVLGRPVDAKQTRQQRAEKAQTITKSKPLTTRGPGKDSNLPADETSYKGEGTMKRLAQNIRTWSGNFDLMTDAFYIEEDRNPVEKERKETEMKDIVKTIVEVMIIIAAVTIITVITQPPTI